MDDSDVKIDVTSDLNDHIVTQDPFLVPLPFLTGRRELGQRYEQSTIHHLERWGEESLVQREYKHWPCQLPGIPKSTFLIAFSPDGSKVASTHGDHNIYVTDVKSGKCLCTLKGHPRTPWCVTFHPSSNEIIASGCLGGEVRVWDLKGGSEVWRSPKKNIVIASLAFHPTDQVLVFAMENEIYFWDWFSPEPFTKIATATEREKVKYVKFDPLGFKLITGIAITRIERHESYSLNSSQPVSSASSSTAVHTSSFPVSGSGSTAPVMGSSASSSARTVSTWSSRPKNDSDSSSVRSSLMRFNFLMERCRNQLFNRTPTQDAANQTIGNTDSDLTATQLLALNEAREYARNNSLDNILPPDQTTSSTSSSEPTTSAPPEQPLVQPLIIPNATASSFSAYSSSSTRNSNTPNFCGTSTGRNRRSWGLYRIDETRDSASNSATTRESETSRSADSSSWRFIDGLEMRLNEIRNPLRPPSDDSASSSSMDSSSSVTSGVSGSSHDRNTRLSLLWASRLNRTEIENESDNSGSYDLDERRGEGRYISTIDRRTRDSGRRSTTNFDSIIAEPSHGSENSTIPVSEPHPIDRAINNSGSSIPVTRSTSSPVAQSSRIPSDAETPNGVESSAPRTGDFRAVDTQSSYYGESSIPSDSNNRSGVRAQGGRWMYYHGKPKVPNSQNAIDALNGNQSTGSVTNSTTSLSNSTASLSISSTSSGNLNMTTETPNLSNTTVSITNTRARMSTTSEPPSNSRRSTTARRPPACSARSRLSVPSTASEISNSTTLSNASSAARLSESLSNISQNFTSSMNMVLDTLNTELTPASDSRSDRENPLMDPQHGVQLLSRHIERMQRICRAQLDLTSMHNNELSRLQQIRSMLYDIQTQIRLLRASVDQTFTDEIARSAPFSQITQTISPSNPATTNSAVEGELVENDVAFSFSTLAEEDPDQLNSAATFALGTNSLATDSLATNSLGTDSLATDSLGTDSLGTDSLGTNSFGTNSLGVDVPIVDAPVPDAPVLDTVDPVPPLNPPLRSGLPITRLRGATTRNQSRVLRPAMAARLRQRSRSVWPSLLRRWPPHHRRSNRSRLSMNTQLNTNPYALLSRSFAHGNRVLLRRHINLINRDRERERDMRERERRLARDRAEDSNRIFTRDREEHNNEPVSSTSGPVSEAVSGPTNGPVPLDSRIVRQRYPYLTNRTRRVLNMMRRRAVITRELVRRSQSNMNLSNVPPAESSNSSQINNNRHQIRRLRALAAIGEGISANFDSTINSRRRDEARRLASRVSPRMRGRNSALRRNSTTTENLDTTPERYCRAGPPTTSLASRIANMLEERNRHSRDVLTENIEMLQSLSNEMMNARRSRTQRQISSETSNPSRPSQTSASDPSFLALLSFLELESNSNSAPSDPRSSSNALEENDGMGNLISGRDLVHATIDALDNDGSIMARNPPRRNLLGTRRPYAPYRPIFCPTAERLSNGSNDQNPTVPVTSSTAHASESGNNPGSELIGVPATNGSLTSSAIDNHLYNLRLLVRLALHLIYQWLNLICSQNVSYEERPISRLPNPFREEVSNGQREASTNGTIANSPFNVEPGLQNLTTLLETVRMASEELRNENLNGVDDIDYTSRGTETSSLSSTNNVDPVSNTTSRHSRNSEFSVDHPSSSTSSSRSRTLDLFMNGDPMLSSSTLDFPPLNDNIPGFLDDSPPSSSHRSERSSAWNRLYSRPSSLNSLSFNETEDTDQAARAPHLNDAESLNLAVSSALDGHISPPSRQSSSRREFDTPLVIPQIVLSSANNDDNSENASSLPLPSLPSQNSLSSPEEMGFQTRSFGGIPLRLLGRQNAVDRRSPDSESSGEGPQNDEIILRDLRTEREGLERELSMRRRLPMPSGRESFRDFENHFSDRLSSYSRHRGFYRPYLNPPVVPLTDSGSGSLLNEAQVSSTEGSRIESSQQRGGPSFLAPGARWSASSMQGVNRFPDVNANRDSHARYIYLSRPSFHHYLAASRTIAGFPVGSLFDTYSPLTLRGTSLVMHRIQAWDFSKFRIPDIQDSQSNLVVSKCRIHFDLSVSISSDGNCIAALIPDTQPLTRVGVYSLRRESLGQLLFSGTIDSNTMCVSISPTMRHLVVGIAFYQNPAIDAERKQVVARIYKLCDSDIGPAGYLQFVRGIELQNDNMDLIPDNKISLNCIRWMPYPGQGLIYGTNRGQLTILR